MTRQLWESIDSTLAPHGFVQVEASEADKYTAQKIGGELHAYERPKSKRAPLVNAEVVYHPDMNLLRLRFNSEPFSARYNYTSGRWPVTFETFQSIVNDYMKCTSEGKQLPSRPWGN
jgi:hypothetical protein